MTLRIHGRGSPLIRYTDAACPPSAGGLPPASQLLAEQLFEDFCAANSLKTILGLFHKFCECVKLRPNDYRTFYTRLKERMSFSWKWKSFQSKLDRRAAQKEYGKGQHCSHNKILVVGAGPCGLRFAIEAALLGAKVVVVEKRDRFSRNNVLHLWPFVITDLRNLGAKKFYPKFCAGSVDHISIRVLQCILLKVALLVGVEVHYGVSFINYLEPPESDSSLNTGWRADVHPSDHHVSSYEFDVLIGADGRRNTLPGFQRKVFRGMLAIAITANFINRNTPDEHNVPEISGVARIYNQQFFKDLCSTAGIDLENIVYYKDTTHYFVMTAKKSSLLAKGVLKEDFFEAERLLDRSNIDKIALTKYALDAAQFSTKNRLPNLEYAINPHGDPDVSVFDFTNMYAAENASRIVEKSGHRLLINLVGDSLIEPFWPLGTGVAHGFLGVFDAAWMLRLWGLGQRTPLQLIVEREATYRTLGSINPEHLCKNAPNYSIDPMTRYLQIDFSKAKVFLVRHLFETDSRDVDKSELPDAVQMRRPVTGLTPKRPRRDTVCEDVLFQWCRNQLQPYGLTIPSMGGFWAEPMPLCALIHHFRPELIDYYPLDPGMDEQNWNLALKICEEYLGIQVSFTASQLVHGRENVDWHSLMDVVAQFHDLFKREKPGEYVSQFSMDSSPSDVFVPDLHRRYDSKRGNGVVISQPRRSSQSSPQPSSGATKRRQLTSNHDNSNRNDREAKETSKRRRPAPARDKELLTHKRRASMEAAQIQINMGEKIKFLEAAFNPPIVPHPALDHGRGGRDNLLSDRKHLLEDRIRSGIPNDVANEKDAEVPVKSRADPLILEKIRQDFREHGVGGLEGRYSPELIKLAVFQDKQKDLMLKLSGDYREEKFTDVDQQLQKAATQLREGNNFQTGTRGHNKVSEMTNDYRTIVQVQPAKTSPTKSPPNFAHSLFNPGFQSSNTVCYFCKARVYQAEKKSAEGLFFHRVCFKCHHCHKVLSLNGDYNYDRYDPSGGKFYCIAHFKFRKHDYSPLLESPSKNESPQKSPVFTGSKPGSTPKENQGVFSFTRYPSRNDSLIESMSPNVSTPRFLVDEEDGDDDSVLIDDDQVLDYNFGGTVVIVPGEGVDEESTTEGEEVDPSEVEVAVENWKKDRSISTSAGRGSQGSSDSSIGHREVVQNSFDDCTETDAVLNACDNDTNSESDHTDSDEDFDIFPSSHIRPLNGNLIPSAVFHKYTSQNSNILSSSLPGNGLKISLKNSPDDDNIPPTIIATDYTQSIRSTVKETPNHSQSDTFFTPLSSPVPPSIRPKSSSNEFKWDSSILETSRRLKEMRMSDSSDINTPSRTGCDEVFFTPTTSFKGGPVRAAANNEEPVRRRLNFEEGPPKNREELKRQLLSATQEIKAAARARAKLKSDEELGRSAGLRSCSRKDRRGSGSSSSDGGDRAKAGKTVVKIGGSPVRKTGVNGKDCAIMDMGDGRTCVAVDGERRAPIALDDEEYDRIGRSQTPSMRSATPVSTADDAEDYFSRRHGQVAEKQFKLETTQLVHKAQEVQRLIQETEVQLKDLDAKCTYIEGALKGDAQVTVIGSTSQLEMDWFDTIQQKKKAERQLQELRLTAEKLELEDRHRRGQEQLRKLLSVSDLSRSEADKKEERTLLDEMLNVRRGKETVNQKLMDFR